MPDLFESLQLALTGRYRLERELGSGGMATVYLARDLKHDRDVAIKVVRPQLSAVIGPERFLREIETTARLSHPGILPLFDSGSANGILWYAMPYFTGRTLQDRLVEGGPLPLPEALSVFRDVAGALDYAHRQGVLHRDLKPGNILLQDGRAVLADFGIALPVGTSAERLTESGLSVGTPEYMSPEQSMGERDLDARSEVYALGCVLYQMLAGEPPFTGTTPQAIIAKRLIEPIPHLSTVRDVPPALDAVLGRSLSRQPVDRFSTIAEFARAVETIGGPTTPVPGAPNRAARWLQPRLITALGLIVAAAVVAVRVRRTPAARFDPNLVIILPARVSSPGNSLDYLREGILDLAAARLTGEGGPRAADSRATLAAVRSVGEADDRALAARLGAGKVLDESVVSDGRRLTLIATLISYPGGARQPPVSVEGTEDSLGVLVDRLMIRVLALHAGEETTALTRVTSLPAWRAYLSGKAAYRSGRYAVAAAAFEQALAADSTFTLAALSDLVALTRAGRDPSARAAMVYRDLRPLAPEDSLWFFATVGPRYPHGNTVREALAMQETMVQRFPDRADAWFELGDLQLHGGDQVDLDDNLGSAERSFEHALALDSSFALPIEHLLFVAYARQDTAKVRHLMALYLSHDSLGERVGLYRWRSAVALGDSAAVARERSRFASYPDQALRMLIGIPLTDGVGIGDAILADSIFGARAATEAERGTSRLVHALLRLTLGKVTPPPIPLASAAIDAALFADGDPAAGEAAARVIRARGPLRGVPDRDSWFDRWELACWDLAHGDPGTARVARAELRAHLPPAADLTGTEDDSIILPGTLDAWLAVHDRSRNAAGAVAWVDSLAATGPRSFITEEMSLLVSRFSTTLGDTSGALRAARRVPRYVQTSYAIPTFRLTQARAAVRAGRTAEAIGAYRLYLALRRDPDPRLVPQRDSARAELAELMDRRAGSAAR